MLAWTGTFGWSNTSIRLSNGPWLLLLLLGTWLAARELSEPRLALLAAFLVATLPVVLHMSRKWFPHFFAAALAPLALFLLLRALHDAHRGKTGLAVFFGLGAVQGLRLHAHPIAVPDVAILFGLLIGGLALLRAPRRAWQGLGLAVALCALIGAPALFAGSMRDGGVGFPEYVSMVWGYLSLSGLELSRIPPRLAWAILPGAALFMVLPGFVGLALPGAPGWSRLGTRLIALRVLFSLPLMLVTLGNGAFVADWLFLAPDCVILCVLGMERLASRLGERARWLVAAALVQGLLTWVAPLVVGVMVEDPLRPGALPWAATLWTHSEHGGTYNTHHIPIRALQPGATLARSVAETPERIGLLDLSWGSAGCEVPPAAGAWVWEPAESGFSAMPGTDPLEEAWGRVPEWRPGDDSLNVLAVRLWQPSAANAGPCDPSDVERAALIRAAQEAAVRRLGGTATLIDDRAQWFASAPRPRSEPVPGYLDAALLITR